MQVKHFRLEHKWNSAFDGDGQSRLIIASSQY